jgi:hypothetical protein
MPHFSVLPVLVSMLVMAGCDVYEGPSSVALTDKGQSVMECVSLAASDTISVSPIDARAGDKATATLREPLGLREVRWSVTLSDGANVVLWPSALATTVSFELSAIGTYTVSATYSDESGEGKTYCTEFDVP